MHSQLLEVVEELISSLTYKRFIFALCSFPILLSLYRLTWHPLRRFPGPRFAACSSFYYLYWIYQGRLPQQLEKLFKYYDSDVIRIAPGQLVFRTAQSFRDIGTSKEAYRGRFNFQLVGFTSNNLTTVRDPEVHRRKRKIMNLGFSAPTLAQQEPTLIRPVVEKLVACVADVQGKVFNIGDYFDCVTTDVIGKLAFGANFHMLDELEAHPFLHVLPNALRMSVIVQAIPPIYRFLGQLYATAPKFLTPKSLRGVSDFATKHMQARAERDEEADDSEQLDIISIIANGTANEKDPSMQMGQRELLGEATTLVAAGGDSAASALSVTMWHLMRHPEIMQDLQHQIRMTFPDYELISSKSVMHDIPLLDAVINESMRLTPVTPGPYWRHIDRAMSIDGHMIPAGTDVGAARLSIWHDEKSFQKPLEFNPWRWLDHKSDKLDAFQPWGLGSRTCIGRQMAMVEMRLILATMLWKFNWEVITESFDNPDFAVLYRAPLLVRAKPRPE